MKPQPVPTSTVCSVCGLPWASHERLLMDTKRKVVRLDECVDLLIEALGKERSKAKWSYPFSISTGGFSTTGSTRVSI